MQARTAPKSALGKAIYYLLEQWSYLTRYLEDGRLELSNNRAERSIKPFVMGRKNWLFANTPGGARASAVIYSLIETAKENELDPYRYLLWVLQNAPQLSEEGNHKQPSFLSPNSIHTKGLTRISHVSPFVCTSCLQTLRFITPSPILCRNAINNDDFP